MSTISIMIFKWAKLSMVPSAYFQFFLIFSFFNSGQVYPRCASVRASIRTTRR
jgi:hypothetical protein